MATRRLATTRSKAKARVLDLGWDKLRQPLESAPLNLPALASLCIAHGKTGPGNAGARKFKRLMPALRWQNPGVEIKQQWSEHDASDASVVVELAGGKSSAVDVSYKSSEDILRAVLQTAGAEDEQLQSSADWAASYLQSLERPRQDIAFGSNDVGLETESGLGFSGGPSQSTDNNVQGSSLS